MTKKELSVVSDEAQSLVETAIAGFSHAIKYYKEAYYKPTEQIGHKIKNSVSAFERLGVVFYKDYKKEVDELIVKLQEKRSLDA